MQPRRTCLAFSAAWVLLALAAPAQAQHWPQRPVKIIVPFAAGGHSDGMARLIAERFAEAFGQQFVVENRPGAAGVLAAEFVARSPADGYTLFMGSPSQIAITPAMTKTPYDPVKDFAPISNIGAGPFVVAIHPGVPATTIGEFVPYVRKQPGRLTYVSSGVNGMVHLSTALFLNRAGLEMLPVSYKGGTAPVADVIAGHVSMYLAILSVALPHAGSGALRLLAVSSEQRVPQIPNIPTLAESGFPGFKLVTWNGLMAPAETPKEIINRLAVATAHAVKDSKFSERLASFGVSPVGNSSEEFAAEIVSDIALWADAVRIAGAREK